MPILVTMGSLHESDQPGTDASGNDPDTAQIIPATGSDQKRLTSERLTGVIRRLGSGFYDSPEVREHIARRVREELGP
jgi:hypothetical protein